MKSDEKLLTGALTVFQTCIKKVSLSSHQLKHNFEQGEIFTDFYVFAELGYYL